MYVKELNDGLLTDVKIPRLKSAKSEGEIK